MSTLKTSNLQNEASATVNMTLDTSGGVTLGAALPVGSGGTGKTTSVAAFNALQDYTTTATSGGTTTLTNTSTYLQRFTGSSAQTIVLPNATTLALGWSFQIINSSTQTLTINSNGGGLIGTPAANSTVTVVCTGVGSASGSWSYSTDGFAAYLPVGLGGTGGGSLSGIVKGNGGSAYTAAVAGTDYVAPGGDGTRVLLNTLTASNSVALQDTTSLTSTYRHYEIVYDGITSASTSALSLLLQVNIAGYQTTGYFGQSVASLGASVLAGSSTAGVLISHALGGSSQTSLCAGRVMVSNPSSTSTYKIFHGTTSTRNAGASGGFAGVCGGFYNGGTGAVTGFQILFNTGNISSGTVKIYGWN